MDAWAPQGSHSCGFHAYGTVGMEAWLQKLGCEPRLSPKWRPWCGLWWGLWNTTHAFGPGGPCQQAADQGLNHSLVRLVCLARTAGSGLGAPRP